MKMCLIIVFQALLLDRVGKVIAPEGKLKGVLNNKMRAGKNDEVLFSAPGYNGIGDTYVGIGLPNQRP